MPEAIAPDGVKLAWAERGSGPAILLAPYFSVHPSIFEGLASALAEDHRVITYDARGTGKSERTGPYDLATSTDDLEVICAAVGGVEAAVCMVDGSSYAVRVAARSPRLLRRVVCVGSAPFNVDALADSDALIASRTVIGAFMQQLETDYRGALRAVIAAADLNLNEDQIRIRVALQAEYADGEAAVGRARSWAADDDAADTARELGGRLQVILTDAMGGGDSWFPAAGEMERIIAASFPEARIHWASDGIVSAAPECAGILRSILASEREYDRQG
jgi:pimeloyl-ACP methyl ester carboxylesterase